MTSYVTKDFINSFYKLPQRIQIQAKKSYKLWKKNSSHKSLEFKKLRYKENIYSVRIGIGWRALGTREKNTVIWFWIGSHEEYNKLTNEF